MTDPASVPLAAGFDPPDEARWRALAEAALKGAPFDSLTGRTADGLPLKPLYRAPDAPHGRPAAWLGAPRDRFLPWDIRVPVRVPDPAAANAEILEALQGGAASIEIVIAGAGGLGVQVDGPDSLGRALAGVLPELAPVAANATRLGARAAGWLVAWLEGQGDPARMRPAFNLDPATPWLADGGLSRPFEDALAEAARFAADHRGRLPNALFLAADGRAAHEAGGSPAQELGLMLASGVAHLRALEAAGVDAEAGARLILARLAAGPDVLIEIAKLRAARLLWARLLEAAGVPPSGRGVALQAIASRRMLTRYDSWTNVLRSTAAAFAAAAGGADVITLPPATARQGEAGALARRLARNTQIILQEEAGLGRVADPAGGAWAVERLTADLAEAAWDRFRAIEAQGGLAVAIRAGTLQTAIAAVRDARAGAIAKRAAPITGLTDFPTLDGPEPPSSPFAPSLPPPPKPAADPITPAAWISEAAPFEALRDVARAAAPRVFCANLGGLADFAPRANFVAALLAAGGVAATGADAPYPDRGAIVAAFAGSKLSVAVLCGTDAAYAEAAAPLAAALKDAGATWVALAGRPGPNEAAWRAAGIDQFLFAGQNAIDALATLHAALGIGP